MSQHEKFVCRRCETSSALRGLRSRGAHRSFLIPGSSPHYAPDRPLRLEHILLDVNVDPRAKIISGTVTQKVRVIGPGQTSIRLDQIGLTIEGVTVGGKKSSL